MSISSIRHGLYQINSMCSALRKYESPTLNEGMGLIMSGTLLGVKAYKISESQKTLKHILISIFTFGMFAIIKDYQLRCVKHSCIEKFKLGFKKIDSVVLKETPLARKISKLINPIFDIIKNI